MFLGRALDRDAAGREKQVRRKAMREFARGELAGDLENDLLGQSLSPTFSATR